MIKMVLNVLRQKLNEAGYLDAGNRVLTKHAGSFPEYSQNNLSKISEDFLAVASEDTKKYYDFFYFSKPMHENELSMLGPDMLSGLQKLGLLEKKDGKLKFKMAVYPFFDHYFLAEPIYTHEGGQRRVLKRLEQPWGSVYMGFESFIIASYLKQIKGDTILDLCCGSGILGISCSSNASKVVGVDLSDICVETAKQNAVLNNVSHKTTFLQGDLYEPVKGKKFDIVCANVPYITVPGELEYPLEGNGGSDGLYLFKKVIEGLPEHLNKGGTAVLIIKSTVDFSKHLDKLKERGFKVEVKCLHKFTDIDAFIKTKVRDTYPNEKFEELVQVWKKHYADLKVNSINLNLITIRA